MASKVSQLVPRPAPLTWALVEQMLAENTQTIESPELCDAPLVSVSLITFNHGDYIRQAITSIVEQQTSFPFELLIGDDASTDGTSEIIEELWNEHPDKIRIFKSTNNLGKYTGNGRLNFVRNLQNVRGKYIALLEGDDFWCSSSKLAVQVAELEKLPNVAGSYHDVTSLVDTCRFDYVNQNERLISLNEVIVRQVPFHTSTFVFRAEHIRPMPDSLLTSSVGDLVLFMTVASRGKLVRIPETMSVYRRQPTSVTLTDQYKGVRLYRGRVQMYDSVRQELKPRARFQFNYAVGRAAVCAIFAARKHAGWFGSLSELQRLVREYGYGILADMLTFLPKYAIYGRRLRKMLRLQAGSIPE